MWPRSHFHLCFWLWIRTRSAVRWVEQEVFLQRSLALPSFEARVLAGLRLCRFLLSCFCFLAHLWIHLLFLQGEEILALVLPFCCYRKPRACCPPLWSTIVRVSDSTNDLFLQSFAFLVGWMCISCELLGSRGRIRKRTSECGERVSFQWYKNECVNTVQSTFHAVIWIVYCILPEIFTLNQICTLHSAQQMSSHIFIPSECKHFAASSTT